MLGDIKVSFDFSFEPYHNKNFDRFLKRDDVSLFNSRYEGLGLP